MTFRLIQTDTGSKMHLLHTDWKQLDVCVSAILYHSITHGEGRKPAAPCLRSQGGNTYKVPEGSSALRVLLYLDHPQRSFSLWLSDASRLLEAQFILALRGSLQFIHGSVFGHQTAVKSTHTNRPLRTPKRKASPGPGRSDSSVNCWDQQAETHPASRRQIKEDHRGGIYKVSLRPQMRFQSLCIFIEGGHSGCNGTAAEFFLFIGLFQNLPTRNLLPQILPKKERCDRESQIQQVL
ncbi:uncharacterized protein LOC118469217 [Amphiprion ocellaris]|uniref:uncharacterized protein LOC118469217 n=1 Tax=Amphiprion ocellaris TaxID=80972 RepID=UPI002410B684|nr:uncharacterized protein LOC118469217 [Amphiprion ocellaris]